MLLAILLLCSLHTAGAPDVLSVVPMEATAYKTTVSLSPRQSFIEPGALCTLQVFAQSAGDSLGCMECHITFDTMLVTLLAAQEGSLFEDSGISTFFRRDSTSVDTQSVVDCLLGYRTYFLPPGEMARFVFQGKQNGSCPVRITFLRLWDINRIEFVPVIDPSAWIFIGTSTGMNPPPMERMQMMSYPNPFSAATTISIPVSLAGDPPEGGRVAVTVYNARGQKILTLFDGIMSPGDNRISWNGVDSGGRTVPAGVYFAEARTKRTTYRTKLVLIH
jgi:hypothetical protein